MSQKVVVGVVFVSAMFMSIMDATIVNVALPTIGRDFKVSPTAVDSISIAFLVSLAVFIPASGWLGDRLGGKRVLLAAIAVFTAASALCGLASSLDELVVFRILQGVGGACSPRSGWPCCTALSRPRSGSGPRPSSPSHHPGPGPRAGARRSAGHRSVLALGVLRLLPLGVAAFAFGLLFLEQPAQDREPGPVRPARFPAVGLGLGLLMYGVSEGPNLDCQEVERDLPRVRGGKHHAKFEHPLDLDLRTIRGRRTAGGVIRPRG